MKRAIAAIGLLAVVCGCQTMAERTPILIREVPVSYTALSECVYQALRNQPSGPVTIDPNSVRLTTLTSSKTAEIDSTMVGSGYTIGILKAEFKATGPKSASVELRALRDNSSFADELNRHIDQCAIPMRG